MSTTVFRPSESGDVGRYQFILETNRFSMRAATLMSQLQESCANPPVLHRSITIMTDRVPHGATRAPWSKMQFAEVLDLIEDVVSPEGIEPARPRPQAEGRVTEFFRGETN